MGGLSLHGGDPALAANTVTHCLLCLQTINPRKCRARIAALSKSGLYLPTRRWTSVFLQEQENVGKQRSWMCCIGVQSLNGHTDF